MNSWVNLDALWRIVVVGLLTGAGLPALFALGLRLLNPPGPAVGAGGTAGEPAIGPATERTAGPAADRPGAGPVGYALAGLLFAVVLAAIGWGISVIVSHR
ncbi:hypothetical protein ACFQ6N_04350 [Kitasatospora sp. NPDC056446]|uniref:hypothetical protein n=1 Tax=Kitasatospora sp. NPDC056446 TaxID=3345819 RepID=UPI0036840489